MIKAKGEREGRPYFLFGLEEGNIERLKQGQPIFFQLDELGLEGYDILIVYGETKEQILNDLEEARRRGSSSGQV